MSGDVDAAARNDAAVVENYLNACRRSRGLWLRLRWLQERERCGDTPLMRDVMAEREQLRAERDLVNEYLAASQARNDELRAERDAARLALSTACEHDKSLRQQAQRLQEALRELQQAVRAYALGITGTEEKGWERIKSAEAGARAALAAAAGVAEEQQR